MDLGFYSHCWNCEGFTTEAMGKNESKFPQTCTTTDGLKMNSVLLAKNLLSSKFEDSELVARPAKESLKRYTDSSEDVVPALGSVENIYLFGDCRLFSSIITAYNNHWKLRTSPDDW